MQTLLSQFCEEFEQVIRPLLAPLGRANGSLSAAARDIPGREILGELTDVAQQLEMLADKVKEQQAYVLIFGPLKSGKSTLMNALSSSYVSEVTSLPAYPCMVYVSHAERRQFTVTRYDGDTIVFPDPTALRIHISRAHADLAERVRGGLEAEETFDPTIHFKQAIRRIDVKAPAGNLARSGAVLVDTPGLYSRMKFGYDRMTREFRNAAACAIFVVKSDNLFLEQVFAEFNDLLELFSRIFLVVNVDSGKCDLQPDGQLHPSLESEDPSRIIETFQALVMSSTLKTAIDEGRLRIYPVDLLRAASRRLRAARAPEGEAIESLPPAEAQGQASFEAFLQDLTDYLNSTDYLVAFLGDSLRRANTLLADTADLCSHPSIARLRTNVDELIRSREDALHRLAAAERLASIGWRPVFGELYEKLSATVREPARKLGERTTAKLDDAIDKWFQTDASLQTLVEDELTAVLLGYQGDIARLVRGELGDRIEAGRAGLRVNPETVSDLEALGLDLSRDGREALASLDTDSLVQAVHSPLESEQVPVKKSFLDWILFRGATTVQRRLLGPPDHPSLRIASAIKARRLGQAAREAIRQALDRYEGNFFADTIRRVEHTVLGDYERETTDRMLAAIEKERVGLDRRLAEVDAQLAHQRSVLTSLQRLSEGTRDAVVAIDDLTERYGKTEPDLLLQPVAPAALPRPAGTPAAPTAPLLEPKTEFAG